MGIKVLFIYPNSFGMNAKIVSFLKALVASRQNIMISGGTSSGKTTLLNLLMQELGLTERIVTIEDVKELQFQAPNTVRLLTANVADSVESPLGTRELLKNCLRMRPDRIIIGEVRGAEAFDLLQAMNTGHQGSMCTIHANSPSESLSRLENLFLFAGFDVPLRAVRRQISNALDFLIQLDRNSEGVRVIKKISEVKVSHKIRKSGESIHSFKNLIKTFFEVLSYFMRLRYKYIRIK